MSQATIAKKKRNRGLYPLIGLVLIIAMGVIAYFLAPSVIDFLKGQNARFGQGMPADRLLLFVTVGLTLILSTISSLIVAVARPKKLIDVKESDLMKERMDAKRMKEYELKRQRKINVQNRAEIRRSGNGIQFPDKK